MAVSSSMVSLGTQAPDFTLSNTSGTMTGRDDFTAAPALLVAFLCNHCPYVRQVETALGRLLSHYPDLAVVGICTNDADAYPDDRPHELAGQARRAGQAASPSRRWPTATDQVDALAATKGTASPADLVPPHPGRVGTQADVPAVQHHSLGCSNLYRSGPDKKTGPAAEAPAPVDPVPAWMHALANQDSTLIEHRLALNPSVQLAVPALTHPGADQDVRQERSHEQAEDRTSGHCGSPSTFSRSGSQR